MLTRMTNATRRDVGTDDPRISASRNDAGIPSSAVRRRARFTWSAQANRTAALSDGRVTSLYRVARSPP